MKIVKLKLNGKEFINIEFDGYGGGTIVSNLKELGEDNFNAAIDAVESLVLAHACSGVDVESPAYKNGISITILTLANKLL